MLTPIRGQHTIALERVARCDAPCSASARSGQTGLVAGQTGFAGEPDEDPTNARPGGTRQGKHTLGCPRLGRPARAPPHAMETRDEQHIGLEEKVKR